MHDVVMPIWWHCGLSGVQYVPSELCYTFWVAARCATSHSVPPAVQIEGCEGWRLSQSTGSSSQNVCFLPTAGLLTFLYIFTKIPLFPVWDKMLWVSLVVPTFRKRITLLVTLATFALCMNHFDFIHLRGQPVDMHLTISYCIHTGYCSYMLRIIVQGLKS